jgi:hypothetical protein
MAKESFKHDKEKIAFIQAVIRAWLERAAYQRLRNAAILMQAAERCLVCSASYDKEKLALLRAQRLAKAWLARKAYGRAVAASMGLQAAGASYMAKKMWKQDKAQGGLHPGLCEGMAGEGQVHSIEDCCHLDASC